MQTFHLSFLVENSFDTINRVLNKFCGKGFSVKSVDFNSSGARQAILNLSLLADYKGLEIISKKLLTNVDVFELLDFSEIRKLAVV
jgi:acetolactate synthase small subunit